VFDGEPLSAVVDEMNRFSQRKLWIADPRVGATPVSGVFKTGRSTPSWRRFKAMGWLMSAAPTTSRSS
jgi:ferric-dicitrate binding protein FerR (iron transport regulator)